MPERVEDLLFDLVGIEIAGRGEHHVADQGEGDVLVGVALARAAGHRRAPQLLGEQRVGLVRFQVAVVGVVGEADAVAEHVAHGDLVGAGVVAQLEGRQLRHDRAVPAHRALGDQLALSVAAKPLDSEARRNTVSVPIGE
jgi:hypothetical protein